MEPGSQLDTIMLAENFKDQQSATLTTIRSIRYQVYLAVQCLLWMKEEQLPSADALLDDIIDELYVRNQAKLYDYRMKEIDLEQRCVTDDLREDTRHQMRRLLNKAKIAPRQRLQRPLIDFYGWVDLAVKCRNARKIRSGQSSMI